MSSSRPSEPAAEVPLVVLLAGTEATLRDAALAELREKALAGAPREFNEDAFDLASSGVDLTAVASALRTLPVIGTHRLVIVRGLSDRRAAKFIEKTLPDYFEDPSDTTCLVLEARSVDRRLRWVKAVERLGQVRSCAAPKRPQELRAWIEARIAAQGKRSVPGCAAALLDRIGPELDQLASEIDKLCLYAGESSGVGPDEVAEVTGELRSRAIYELSDAIGNRRLEQALRLLARLLGQGEAPLALLAGLANHYRRLIRARECVPLEAGEVQRRLSVHPYTARLLAEQARRLDPWRLRRCLDAIHRTDAALKGSVSLSPELAIEQLVLAVCA
jgi:DNA polymerase-3 subunit delta